MRLIDADELRKIVEIKEIIEIIDKAPTIDAVPKTQCRDCQFSGRYSGIDLRRINATD